jgi:hypothetical protein
VRIRTRYSLPFGGRLGLSGVLAVGLVLAVADRALATLPPPQEFVAARGGEGKSQGALVISAYNSALNPRGAAMRTGSEFDTQLYCRAVLDIIADVGARGTLSIRGSATPIGTLPNSVKMDEVQPLHINVASEDLRKIIIVPLRHDATFFDWEPSKDSTGAITVWATALPCSMGTSGIEATP